MLRPSAQDGLVGPCGLRFADLLSTPTIVDTKFALLGLMLVVVIWVLVVASRRPQWLQHRRILAAIVFTCACVQGPLNLLFSPRQETIVGAESSNDPRIIALSQILTAAIIGGSILAILLPATRLSPGARVLVAASWLFAGALLVSGAVSTEAPQLAKPALMLALAVHAVVAGVDDPRTLLVWAKRVLRPITAISLASIAISPSWAFIGASLGEVAYDRTLGGLPRLTGLAPHPGALAMVSLVSLILEVGSTTGRKSWRVFACGLAIACIALSQCRTVWIAAAIALLTMGVIRIRTIRHVGVLVLSITAVTVMANPALVYGTDWTGGSANIATVSGRTDIWAYSILEFSRHPLFGYGPGFLDAEYRTANLPATEQQAIHAHNQFFQTMGEGGLIGLIALGVLVLTLMCFAYLLRRQDGGMTFALISSLMIVGVTDVPLRPVGLIMIPPLVTLPLIAISIRLRSQDRSPDVGEELGRAVLAPLESLGAAGSGSLRST